MKSVKKLVNIKKNDEICTQVIFTVIYVKFVFCNML